MQVTLTCRRHVSDGDAMMPEPTNRLCRRYPATSSYSISCPS